MKMKCKICGKIVEGSSYDMKLHIRDDCKFGVPKPPTPSVDPNFNPQTLLASVVANIEALRNRRADTYKEKQRLVAKDRELSKELAWLDHLIEVAEDNQPPQVDEHSDDN